MAVAKEGKMMVPPSPEILAEAIIRISKAFNDLSKSGVNRKAIIVLLHDQTKVSKATITYILNALEDLRRQYTR